MEGAEKRRTLYSCRGAAPHSKVAGYVAAAQNEKNTVVEYHFRVYKN
jgi:hypothetical protein